MKRRNFIKRFSAVAAGTLIIPPFLRSSESKAAPLKSNYKPNINEWREDEINIAWIGHATVLINFYGTIILTDPVLYERVGLYFLGVTIGPARYTAPALNIDEIPKPDLVLLSHAHMDHTDYKTLINLTDMYPKQIDCVTAYNTMDVTNELAWKSIQEMDWGNELELPYLKLQALEVKHFGWRYPWERDRSKGYMENGRSYNAYIIEKEGKKILFGGDTAYHELFKPFADTELEVAIMPIGAYNPWKKNHCNPEEALIMASEHLKAKRFIPIHFNTFKQGSEPIDEPLAWLRKSIPHYRIKNGIDEIGQTYTLSV